MVNAAEGGHDLACQGINFVAPDGAARLIDTLRNIAEVSQVLFLIFTGRAPPFKDTLDCIQFAYTVDRTGDYVAPVSNVLVPSAV